jgi:ABC-2 type transport system permease protein
MSALVGLFKKELRVAFTTPLAWVVLFAFASLASLFFWLQLTEFERTLQRVLSLGDRALAAQLDFNDLILGALYANLQLVLLFVMPLLTMRAVAEERQRKTLELLLTAPIRAWEIAAAKLSAVFVLVVVLAVFLLLYPALLASFGASNDASAPVVDWGQVLAGTLGFALAGFLFASVGFAFSCMTATPALAGLLAFVTLVLAWFLGSAGHEIPGAVGDALSALSPASHVERLVRGVLHGADVAYYASGIALCFLCGCMALEARRSAP